MKKGYNDAIALAEQALSALAPDEVVRRCGVFRNGGEYIIPWMGAERLLSSGSEFERVLWLHYLTGEGRRELSGQLIAYREVPGASFYEEKFTARAVRPIVKRFGADPAGILAAGAASGGTAVPFGDAAVTVPVLPYLPVTYIIWRGDDEMPAEGNILFDRTAVGWLPAEDLVVLASLGAYKLAGFGK